MDERTTRAWALAIEGFGVVLAAATIVLFRDCVVDDAYISLRYVDNLLHGNGLVFNPGERVEGITNLGWVVWIAAVAKLGLDPLVVARVSGVLGLALAVWLGPRCVLPEPDRRLTRALARLWCLASFSLVYLAWTGLETAAFAGLVALLVELVRRAELRLSVAAGIVAGLAFATRPEGALVVGVVGLVATARHGLAATLRAPGTWVFAAAFVGIELFRFVYFGAWVPHTAVVKGMLSVGSSQAAPWYGTFGDDIVEFFAQTGGVIVLLLLVVALARGVVDREGGALAVAACGALAAFAVYSGGDWMLGYRYLVPMLPLYAALAAAGAVAVFELAFDASARRGSIARAAAVALVGVSAVYLWSHALRFRQDIGAYPNFVMTSRDMTTAARWLAQHYPPQTQVTCWRIGALAYHSGLRVIDTNGLTDLGVPEHLHDPAALDRHLAERAPRLAILPGVPGATPDARRPLYGATYEFVREFPQGRDQTWLVYERR